MGSLCRGRRRGGGEAHTKTSGGERGTPGLNDVRGDDQQRGVGIQCHSAIVQYSAPQCCWPVQASAELEAAVRTGLKGRTV